MCALATSGVLAAGARSAGAQKPAAAASPAAPAATAAGVHATLTRAADLADGRMVLLLQVEATGLGLGSYQGAVTFDPTQVTVDSAVAPSGDGSRLVNANDAAKGLVRYAGYTTSSFRTGDAVRFVVRVKSLDAAKFATTLDVAGDVNGTAIAKTLLHGSAGVRSSRGTKPAK